MDYKEYGWTFNSVNVANEFDTHVRQSVPCYDEFHKMIKTFAQYYIEPMSKVLDIGCSTGHLLVEIANANSKPSVNFIGIDTSTEMIAKASAKQYGSNVEFKISDIRNFKCEDISFAYSMLCLQFLPLADRKATIETIYEGMRHNGMFLLVEKVKSSHIDVHDIYNDIYYDFKRSQGLSEKEILDKNVSLRGVMKPLTMKANIRMLEEVGFTHVEVFMKYNNFVGIVAVK